MEKSAHAQMNDDMTRRHYRMLVLNLSISLVIMYFVMFTMIWTAHEFYNNLNMLYMALTMAAPMGMLMLVMMPMTYTNAKLNLVIYGVLTALLVLGFWGTRTQALVNDRQFVRAMIPHHSGAILMCQRAALHDAEIREICFKPDGIVDSQAREIQQFKAFLARAK